MGESRHVRADQQGLPLRKSQQHTQVLRARRRSRCAELLRDRRCARAHQPHFRPRLRTGLGLRIRTCRGSDRRIRRTPARATLRGPRGGTHSALVPASGRSGQTIDRDQQSAAARRRSVHVCAMPTDRSTRQSSSSRFSARASPQRRASTPTCFARCFVTPICSSCRKRCLRARTSSARSSRATNSTRTRSPGYVPRVRNC